MEITNSNESASVATQQNKNELFLIVGMHRSGTSVIGQLMHRLGFYFGNNLLKEMSGVNDSGFWEDKIVVEINEKILNLLGSSWHSFQKLPDKWWDLPEMHDCSAAIDDWYVNFYGKYPTAIKDPRLCRLYPIWNKYFIQKGITPRTVFVFRNPESVALSLKKRDHFSLMVGYLLWLTYIIEAIESIAASGNPHTLVCYDKLVDSPITCVESILAEDFGDVKELKRFRTRRIIYSTILPALNHHKKNNNSYSTQIQPYKDLAENLYNDLNGAAIDIKSLAKNYSHQFNTLLNQNSALITSLQDEANNNVTLNSALTEIGSLHTLALETILKKDKKFDHYSAEAEKKNLWQQNLYQEMSLKNKGSGCVASYAREKS